MNICLDMSLASKYTSHSQMARVVTEQWIEKKYVLSALWIRSYYTFKS